MTANVSASAVLPEFWVLQVTGTTDTARSRRWPNTSLEQRRPGHRPPRGFHGIHTHLHQQIISVVLATSTTISQAFDARPGAMFGLVVPSTFDGTAITFQVSHDNVTYQALYDEFNVAVGLTVAASRSYNLPSALAPWAFWKIVCGSAQTTTDTAFVWQKGEHLGPPCSSRRSVGARAPSPDAFTDTVTACLSPRIRRAG